MSFGRGAGAWLSDRDSTQDAKWSSLAEEGAEGKGTRKLRAGQTPGAGLEVYPQASGPALCQF